MADEYKIQIGTEADTSGAKEAEKAINQLGSAAEEAAGALESVGSEAQDVASGGGKALNQTLEGTAQSAEGTRKILGGLGALMGGNLLFGVQELTQGFRALNVTMGANPAGKLIAGLTVLAGGWAVVAKALQDADTAAKDLEGGMKGASTAADTLGSKAAGIDKIKEALSGAADQADRLRKAKDETSDIDTALKLSEVDLKEAKREITPDEARSERTGIRAENQRAKLQSANEADTAQIKAAEEQQRKIDEEAEAASQRAARAKAYAAQKAAEANAAGAPTDLIVGGDFTEAKREAARQLEEARNTGDEMQAPDFKEIERAKQAVDTLDDFEAAQTRAREASEAEAKTQEARKKSAEETGRIINEKTKRVREREKESATLQNRTTTEDVQLQNDQDARTEKEAEAAAKKKKEDDAWLKDAQGFVKNHQEIRDLDPFGGKPGERTPLEESQAIAKEGKGLEGRSPEMTQRVQKALSALEDGGTAEEIANLTAVLNQLIQSLQQVGSKRTSDAQAIKQRVTQLEGIVNRLDNEADT